MRGRLGLALALALVTATGAVAQSDAAPPPRPATVGTPGDGYRGIWYANQPSDDEYAFKYSGGLGTYCAKHAPFAVHSAAANKTFFCYGGVREDADGHLVHMVAAFDHATGTVPRPTLLLDKHTGDAHDNPVLQLDADGHVFVFSTSHGRSRPSFVHRSVRPYDVTEFARVDATFVDDDGEVRPWANFSYLQAWYAKDHGFVCFFTRYADPAARTSMFITSPDGVHWSKRQRIAAIDEGHYQISALQGTTAAAAFNYHPKGKGLNARANLYYVATPDLGATWRTATGEPLDLPVTEVASAARIYDSEARGELVYLKDIRLDPDGNPAILFVTSRGYASGPASGPRTWQFARYRDGAWAFATITESDNNYDMGSLYGDGGTWRVIAPTLTGPQRFNPGGEVAVFDSDDDGRTWKQSAQLTADSPRNHTYVRRPVDAHPDFIALWADGDARRPSASRLWFCNAAGTVFGLPATMTGDTATPERR